MLIHFSSCRSFELGKKISNHKMTIFPEKADCHRDEITVCVYRHIPQLYMAVYSIPVHCFGVMFIFIM